MQEKDSGRKEAMQMRCPEPVDMLCEYAKDPLGIDTAHPRFSWKIEGAPRGFLQSAYRILVSDSPDALAKETGNIWDSGKVFSGQSVHVEYNGKKLRSRGRYFWKVKIWDLAGNESRCGVTARFEMGLLDPADWKAKWIGSPVFGAEAPSFRKTFRISKKLVKARAYISGLGYYELFINGRRIGDHVLDPAWTDYRKRVLYVTYAAEDFLREDCVNTIGVMLGAGWYGKMHRNNVHNASQLLFQLEMEFADGTKETVATGLSAGWEVHSGGPVLFSSIYDGEHYDAGREIPNWRLAGSDAESTASSNTGPCENSGAACPSSWEKPLWMEPPGGRMVSQMQEPIRAIREIPPQSAANPADGIFVYDFGENIAGWAALRAKGPRGGRAKLRYAELLYADGTVNQENLRTAKAEDIYIFKGDGLEYFEPRFTCHGFRYVQVETSGREVFVESVTGKAVHSDVPQTGEFSCSDPLLNRIHEAIVRTEENNLHGLPTDCPQRDERLAWLNDMTVRAEEAVYNFNLVRLFEKWENDIADTQGEETGAIADTAPFMRFGRRPADPVCASYLLVPWLSYLHFGDRRILEDHYDGMKRWLRYLSAHADGCIVDYSSYGDWASPAGQSDGGSIGAGAVSARTPGKLMSTGFYFYCAELLSQIAAVLGKTEDATIYSRLAVRIRRAFNAAFLNRESGCYAAGSQASDTFALFLNMPPKTLEKRVQDHLAETLVKTDGCRLTTGNICTKYILEVLCETGRPEIAHALATQTDYPSWGYMIQNGATTIWERWEHIESGDKCEMASHDHPMYGSIGAWFYKFLGGISPDPEGPGFEKITIRPFIMEKLSYVRSSLQTVRGPVRSDWEKSEDGLLLNVGIPANASARIHIPKSVEGRQTTQIFEGRTLLWERGTFFDNPYVAESAESQEDISFFIGSGEYRFAVSAAKKPRPQEFYKSEGDIAP